MLPYQELVSSVADRVAVDTDEARAAAEATVAVLAHTLDEPGRQRLREALPGRLRERVDQPSGPGPDTGGFVTDVSRATGLTAEQARYRAQAVLSTLAEHEPDLLDSLDLPAEIRDMYAGPAPGGGITGPHGHAAPLTRDELAAALAGLPGWGGDTHAISRTLTLPRPDLVQVLGRLEALRHRGGRAPDIDRDGDTAVITVRTAAVDAVTGLDVDLAHQVDAIVAEGTPSVRS